MNPYVDPNTGVLYNKLGITNAEELREAEYNATWVRGLELRSSPVLGQFDFDHLKAIHKSLFQDIYPWAGEERSVNFSKRVAGEPWWTTKFDRLEMLKVRMEVTGEYLREKNFLRELPREQFALEVAKVYVSLNAAHPFAEGNGRSTQTFLSQLATEAGHRLDFGRVDRDSWIHAAARSMEQVNVKVPSHTRAPDMRPIANVFQQITVPLREQTQEAQKTASLDQRAATAFVSLPREEATKLYPHLTPGFDRLDAVATRLTQEGKPATYVADFLQAVKEQLGRHLEAGQKLGVTRDEAGRVRGTGLER